MGWITVTTRYEEVRQPAEKNLPCPGCGKKVRRRTTFTQTLNPWNKNPDGSPKNRRQIMSELRAQAAEWKQKPEYHEKCRP